MINYWKNLTWEKTAKISFILMAAYFIFISGICLFKFFTFSYTGSDLAIFNQVFYNSSIGNLFHFTIHPTSYLGDHFAPIILLLLPFYQILQSPIALLLMQAFFLAIAAIPLFLIAQKHLSPGPALLLISLYLFNPATLNISLYEYHLLPMVPFFIFWVFYFYDNNKFPQFMALAALSLLIREDVAFIVFMFGIVAILDKKKIKWILSPIILAAIYFFTAIKIVGHFSASSSYKFIIYYSWLGSNTQEIAVNFFIKFNLVIQYLLNYYNLELILILLLIFLFIPIFRPKYVLLSLGMFLQLIMGKTPGANVISFHYGIIIVAALTLASVFSLKHLLATPGYNKIIFKYKDAFILLVIGGLLYNFLILGPLIPFVRSILTADYQEIRLKKEFAQEINSEASLLTTYDFLGYLSSRKKIYALNYTFTGKQQYGAGDYIIPEDTQYILINFNDLIIYNLQYPPKLAQYYFNGDDNLRKLLKENNYALIKANKNLALWQKQGEEQNLSIYNIFKNLPEDINSRDSIISQDLIFKGYAFDPEKTKTSLYFQALANIEKNYFLKINNELYSLGWGIYPTSEWQTNEIIEHSFYNLGSFNEFEIIDFSGGMEMDRLGVPQIVFDKTTKIGEVKLD